MKKTLLAASLFALSVPAFAQTAWSPGFYAGFGVGQAKTDDELVKNRESTITVATNIRTNFDDQDSAWKGFAGYRFTPWFAVELNYADLGEHSTDTRFDGGDPPSPGQVIIRRQVKGFGADLLLHAPFNPMWSIFGRLGIFRADMDASAQLGGNVVFPGSTETFRSTSQRENITRYGIGGDFNFMRNLTARLEWERYAKVGKKFEVGNTGTTGEADMDAVTLSLVYRFQ
jgi:OOP family OmpA-OmpF porin